MTGTTQHREGAGASGGSAGAGPGTVPSPVPSAPAGTISNGWALLLGALVLWRGLYHLAYLGDSEFAAATFSDGRAYFDAAYDILRHPPWGTEPFYLQGLYAYFVAAALAVAPTPAAVMFLQLLAAWAAIGLFFRAGVRIYGRPAAAVATALLLASAEAAFYENKFLSASIGISANLLVLWATARAARKPTVGSFLGLGGACGLSILARANMVLLLPFVLFGAWRRGGRGGRRRAAAAVLLGVLAALAPMAVRNLVVTGTPSVMPAHGGGTSFYIGNNPHSPGVWNTAGGLVTPDVTRERDALAQRLGLFVPEDGRAEAVGRELYRRAFAYARRDPAGFLRLQLRKLYLMLGNDPITQDYDWYGEQEMIGPYLRFALPFGAYLAVGTLGLCVLAVRRRADPALGLWTLVLVGQLAAVAAANVVYFTSAQHRVPLVPPLAALGGPVVLAASRGRWPLPGGGKRPWCLAAALLLCAQAFVPRLHDRRPSATHYFNLAVVRVQLGLEAKALEAVEAALARRPDHPLMRLEHARLLYRLRRFDEAEGEARALADRDDAPPFVRDQARRLLAVIALERRLAAEEEARAVLRGSGDAPRNPPPGRPDGDPRQAPPGRTPHGP